MPSINFHNAKFCAAYGTAAQLPASSAPEVSFSGRSNVGKSSLLNKLMFRKGLAKVSSTPGKTATINFYDVDGVDFVDLPGYGYAKVSKSELSRWSDLIRGTSTNSARSRWPCSSSTCVTSHRSSTATWWASCRRRGCPSPSR